MKVLNIEGDYAVVEVSGLKKKINIQLLNKVRAGDYVIVHAGFAIQKLDTKEAEETLHILKQIK